MVDVKIENLTKKFGKVTAVDNISFTAKDKEFTTLLGPSGCGKTTILRLIAGLEIPDNGKIWIDDKLVSDTGVSIIPTEKRSIGMVFQSYALWPHMTVFDNIAFPLKIRKLSKDEIKRKIRNIVSLVKLNGLEGRYPWQLSGGQEQRVALARAMVYNPEILLLDEPFSNLDANVREKMRYELKKLQGKIGITTIYVTHDQIEARILSDKIIIINNGTIIQEGAIQEILKKPANKFVAKFIKYS